MFESFCIIYFGILKLCEKNIQTIMNRKLITLN